MLKVGLTIIVVLVLAFFGASLLLPSHWKVQRSIVINAPAEKIYEQVANLKNWPQWSAFDQSDPSIQYTYFGPETGVGAERAWVSKKMGDGSQRIVHADKSSVDFALEMKGNGFRLDGQIAMLPEGAATRVTWTDTGVVGYNPLHRAAAMMLDKMMGPTFEKSLATLKDKTEAPKR